MTKEELFDAAKDGSLPDDFSQWNICDESGWSIAHEAAKHNNLPSNFNRWNIVDNYGWTVAHQFALENEDWPVLFEWGI